MSDMKNHPVTSLTYPLKASSHRKIAVIGGGIAGMIDPSRGTVYHVLYTLLVLTYSTFCLTSLDTATRMGRFMFQEFWIDGSKGETPENVTGFKKVMANPYVATVITVVLGILLGLNGYQKIWALFGSANQLLAALALLAVATWLGNVGKNNKMFLIPMAFMLVVTICSLIINTKTQIGLITKGGADWGPYVQAILGVLLVIPLALFGTVAAIMLRGMDNNIYVQIGMLLLIAMSSKNALILVLYARRYGEQGMTAMQAAHKAASVRFRPILMSSLAYAVGALPMLWATGAGAINQQYLGTAVFGGMVATALLTVLYAPFFYAVFMGLSSKLGGKRTPEPKQA